MQGSIAQTLALVMHGNARLRGMSEAPFFPYNSTCQFCKQVDFEIREPSWRAWRKRAYAGSPDEWYRAISRDGVRELFVDYSTASDPGIADRMSVAFVGGGGHWQIIAFGDSEARVWEARWTLGDKDDPERRIWNVTYEQIGLLKHVGIDTPDLDVVADRLMKAFTAISTFAHDRGVDNFGVLFDNAIACLRSDGCDRGVYHRDLWPDGFLPPTARRILSAAQIGWVFGGMGSWNDLSFEGATQERYDTLSEDLYLALNRAMATAANASARSVAA